MRRHLRTSPRMTPCKYTPNRFLIDREPPRSMALTVLLAACTGLAIGYAVRTVQAERQARQMPASVLEVAGSRSVSENEPDGPPRSNTAQERAKYSTFEEAMGLWEGTNGIYFRF